MQIPLANETSFRVEEPTDQAGKTGWLSRLLSLGIHEGPPATPVERASSEDVADVVAAKSSEFGYEVSADVAASSPSVLADADVVGPARSGLGGHIELVEQLQSQLPVIEQFMHCMQHLDIALQNLSVNAQLEHLPSLGLRVGCEVPGQQIAVLFQRYQSLPGVIVMCGDTVSGVVSRRLFFESVGRPYGVELFLRHPIERLVQSARLQPLLLDSRLGIDAAALSALSRPVSQVYEPVVVVDADRRPALLDAHVLLLGQSQLLTLANQALAQERDVSKKAMAARSDFLARMSHEIRTPMNAIIGMTELAMDGDLSEEQRQFLQTVQSSGESLLELINDILDFSKIDAGKLRMESTIFNLSDMISDSLQSVALRAHRKGLSLAFRQAPGVPRQVEGDPTRLRQVITNLVTNAIKFTDAGEVVVQVVCAEPIGDDMQLHFSVRDTGIGIPEAAQSKIFEAFEQADGSTTRKFGGTGLGLSICRQLVGMMDGRIWLESEPGVGSTFHFTARFGSVDIESPADPYESVDGVQVLVIEHHPTQKRILSEMFEQWGVRVLTAGDHQTGRQLLLERQSVDPIQLVLSCLETETGSAGELMDWCRAHLADGSMPVLVSLDADQLGMSQSCRSRGIAGCLARPVKPSALYDMMMDVLFGQEAGRHCGEQSSGSGTERLRILLVEDNPVNQAMAVCLLEKAGHTVAVAGDGQSAVEYWQCHQSSVDVILMDVQMPVMDGYQATRRIRQLEGETSRRVPIIALTAHAMADEQSRCLDCGMSGYLTKPIRRQKLFQALAAIEPMFDPASVEALEAQWTDAKDAGPTDAVDAAEGSALGDLSSVADIQVDLDALCNQMEGDMDLLESLRTLFCAHYPDYFRQMGQAFADGDAVMVAKTSHLLRGSVSNFQCQPVLRRLSRLEQLAKAGRLSEAWEVYQPLRGEVDALAEALTQLHETGWE